MIDHRISDCVTGSEGHRAAAVLEGLPLVDGLPTLTGLAEKIARVCCRSGRCRALAVLLPLPGSAILEKPGARAQGRCLLLTSPEGEPVWTDPPPAWDLQGRAAGITGGHGAGSWPSAADLPRDEGQCMWQELVVCLAGQPVLGVRVLHPGEPGLDIAVEDDLRHLRDTLKPLLGVWATARKLETQLHSLQAENQALARLNTVQEKAVAMASHEFKTPLTSITAYSDALRAQITDAEFPHATEFLDVIRTEAGRLLRMANRVLDYSRLGAGLELLEVRPEPLAPLLEDALLALRPAVAGKGLRLECDCPAGLPRIMADADMVRQVLVNLLSNAIKYTPEGGTISVAVAEVESALRVTVADTGMGIPDADLQRIFREFYRTRGEASRQEGTGLGLTIVRHILNLHGGHIHVSRRPAGGTEFACDLPKEVVELAPLPLEFSGRVDRDRGWRLITLLVYLAAELTGSRSVALKLRDGRGGQTAVAGVGATARRDSGPRQLTIDLGRDQDRLGSLVVADPVAGTYPAATHGQLAIIADLVALALRYLTPESPQQNGSSSSVQVTKVTEAVRAVLQIRRSGIPTSTPEALDLVERLGSQLGVGAQNIRRLKYAALLHDAGMARVEVEIVLGESELSWDQRDEVERHVEQGVDLMAPLLLDRDIATVIRHHHERVDGKGYPRGLRGDEIPLGARLLAVIDTWFALTRERTFRPGLEPAAALQEIKNHSGTQFDQKVVEAFEKILSGEGIPTGPVAGTRN
jgi:signal transduction histidine kinase